MKSVLLVMGSPDEGGLAREKLGAAGYELEFLVADSASVLESALQEKGWDVALLDYENDALPFSRSMSIFQKLAPETPVVVVSSYISDREAIEVMKTGATDILFGGEREHMVVSVERAIESGRKERERMAANEALKESQALYQAVFEGSANSLFIIDDRGHIVDVNESACRDRGYQKADLIGEHISCLVHPDDHHLFRRFPQTVDRNQIFTTKARNVRRDGSIMEVEVVGSRLHLEGKPHLLAATKDISREKAALVKLEENEQRFRAFTDISADWFWESDANQVFTLMATNKLFEFDGKTSKDFVGKSRRDLLKHLGISKEQADALVLTMEKGDAVIDYRMSFEHPDLGETWISISGQPIRDEEGAITGYRGIGKNVTEQVKAERALRESEARLRAILDNAPIAVCLKDLEGRYLAVNNTYCDRMEKDEKSLLGNTSFDVFDRERAEIFSHNDRAVIEEGRSAVYEGALTFSSGESREYLIYEFPIRNEHGEIFQVGSVSVDVTKWRAAERALKQSEATLRGFIDHAPLSINLKDDQGRFLLANERFCSRMGVHEEDLLGKSSHDLFDPDRADVFVARQMKVIETGKPLSEEVQVREANGELRDYLFSVFPIVDDDGLVRQAGSISFDMTDRRETERQLQQAQKMEAIGQLTAGIAHDFNNLLTVIVGNGEVLLEELNDDEELRDMISLIVEVGAHGADLTQQLLSFGRRQSLIPEAIAINKTLDDLGNLLRRSIGESVELVITPDPDDSKIYIDESQLETALLNLALNARDALPDGGRIEIAVSRDQPYTVRPHVRDADSSSHQFLAIRVSDTGTGIPADIQPRVLDPFFTTKGPGKGTGMGLSMVYGFVKQSGGQLDIESQEGRGTTVTLYLPLFNKQRKVRSDAADDGEGKFAPAGNEHILVVEDNEVVRQWVVGQIKRLGYKVSQAADGASAIEAFRNEEDIDLILSDIVMPGGLSGIELVKQLCRMRPGVKFLLSTGYSDHEDETYRELARRKRILKKPYKVSELAKKMREILDNDTNHGQRLSA